MPDTINVHSTIYGMDLTGNEANALNNNGIANIALEIASDGCEAIDAVLRDIVGDSMLGAGSNNCSATLSQYSYTLSSGISIDQAAGAMVIDDLMQRISTKVQVAAQLLSTANKNNQTVQRIMNA